MALLADVQHFARQTVTDVHHAGGCNACILQCLDNILARFGLELTFEQILTSLELRLELGSLRAIGTTVGSTTPIIEFLPEHRLLSLEELQAHIGSSQVSAHTDQVVRLGSIAIDRSLGYTYGSDRNSEACHRRRSVTSHQIDAINVTSKLHAGIKFVEILHTETLRNTNRHRNLTRSTHHGINIAEVHDACLVAQMTKRAISQVEMDAFKKKIGSDHRHAFLRQVVDHRTIVTYPIYGAGILERKVFGEMTNQAEFAVMTDFHTC